MIDNAISVCMSERKPVYLEIPCNLALQQICKPCPIATMRYVQQPKSDILAMDACVEHIIALIEVSKRPVLVAGAKLRKCHAITEFMHLATELGCGIVTLPDGKGLIMSPLSHSATPF